MLRNTVVAFAIGICIGICNHASAQPTNGTIDAYLPFVNGVAGTSYNAGNTLQVIAAATVANPAGNPERTIQLRVEVYDHNGTKVHTSTSLTTLEPGESDSMGLSVQFSAPSPLNGNHQYYFICDLYYLNMGMEVSLASDDEQFNHLEM